MPQILDRAEFAKLHAAGKSIKPPAETANWDELFAISKVVFRDLPFTVSEFYIDVVKGQVSRQRTSTKIGELHAQGKLLRVYRKPAYYYMWDESEL